MPLYLRHLPLNFLVGDRYFVLSGNYVAGSISQQSGGGFSAARWHWGAGFHDSNFFRCGTVDEVAEAQSCIALNFRRNLSLAGLAEREDARPGDILPTQLSVRPTSLRDIERNFNRRRALDWPRRALVYSGALMVGMLNEMSNVEDVGWWHYSVDHHLPWPIEDFQWQGLTPSIEEGFDAISACWATCLYVAGLEQRAPLRMGRLLRSLT